VAVDVGTMVGVSGLLIGLGAVLLGRFPGGIDAAVRRAGDWLARPVERPATRRLSPAGRAVAARATRAAPTTRVREQGRRAS